MERKIVKVELKQGAEESGEFRAVIATFNAIDHDGDVTLPGAFPEGKVVPISAYGHTSWGGNLPVGKGVIHQDGERAWVDGKFFLDTTPGNETYLTIKALVADADGSAGQEWSYGYDPTESELGQFDGQDVRFLKVLDVHEVSPVLLGAGIDTGLVSIKDKPNMTFAEEGDSALAAVGAFTLRARSLAGLRAKDGRDVSEVNRDRLAALGVALTEAAAQIDVLLVTEPADVRSAIHARALGARADEARIRADLLRGAP